MYNPLNTHPQVREVLLFIQWLITGLQTVIGVLFGFLYGADVDNWPMWFLASLAVAPVLWAYLGFTAQHNVTGNDATGKPIDTNPRNMP